MWTSEHEHNTDGKTATALAAFTAVELARLERLRERHAAYLGYAEQGLDLRRLEFARWLVQRGILSEEL
jgi:ABC-type branched-subunit amino acid transport system ATPase component